MSTVLTLSGVAEHPFERLGIQKARPCRPPPPPPRPLARPAAQSLAALKPPGVPLADLPAPLGTVRPSQAALLRPLASDLTKSKSSTTDITASTYREGLAFSPPSGLTPVSATNASVTNLAAVAAQLARPQTPASPSAHLPVRTCTRRLYLVANRRARRKRRSHSGPRRRVAHLRPASATAQPAPASSSSHSSHGRRACAAPPLSTLSSHGQRVYAAYTPLSSSHLVAWAARVRRSLSLLPTHLVVWAARVRRTLFLSLRYSRRMHTVRSLRYSRRMHTVRVRRSQHSCRMRSACAPLPLSTVYSYSSRRTGGACAPHPLSLQYSRRMRSACAPPPLSSKMPPLSLF